MGGGGWGRLIGFMVYISCSVFYFAYYMLGDPEKVCDGNPAEKKHTNILPHINIMRPPLLPHTSY